MIALARPELIIFTFVVAGYFAGAVVGVLQLLSGGERYRRFLQPVVCLAICGEAVLLIFRAAAIKAFPLTGLFESMIVLTMVFGLLYLFFSIAVQQVWFGSVMVWVILAMVLMAGAAAEPASQAEEAASTPWAIAHGVAMILGGACITFATASAVLYLLGRGRLKQKKVMAVLGRVPNLESLERMNLFGTVTGFVLITIGLASGLGLASLSGGGVMEWLSDGKVGCMIAVWTLLGSILALSRVYVLKGKGRAYMTVAVFILVLFAFSGVSILGTTRHDFSRAGGGDGAVTEEVER
jgi:ABC-type uncharacterized transport system permease subunit